MRRYSSEDSSPEEVPKYYHRKTHHESHKKTSHHRKETAENALNDFYGGTATFTGRKKSSGGTYGDEAYRPTSQRPGRSSHWNRQSRIYTAGVYGGVGAGVDITSADEDIDSSAEDRLYLFSPPHGKYRGDWKRAARFADEEKAVLYLHPTLVMTRHGHRYQSQPFVYEEGWDDGQFATELKHQYSHLKLQDVGILQKIVAYKTIAYVNVLQARCTVLDRRWVVTKTAPITSKNDKEGRDTFMYLLRYPTDERRWTRTVDNLLKPGVILYLEVVETFDASKIYLGIFLMTLLSLGVALAYGFLMDRDFGTGFSIAGWMITAFGFFIALVSIAEVAGLERVTSFQTGAMMEESDDVPRELRRSTRSRY
ncbi:hypothetical protein Q7P37_006112 [Cladosporium fusiforme]